MAREKHPIRWVIWGLAVAFYFYEYILRVQPSVMLGDLMAAFGVNAAAVGLMSAGYFYVYAPMQIPVGVLMDRFGARKLLTLGTLTCGCGSILLALVSQFGLGMTARGLMGFGSSFAFVGMIYVTSHWFSGKVLALLIGIGNSLGMAGAMWGEALLGLMIDLFGWRWVTFILGAAGILMGLGIYLIFKLYSGPPSKQHDTAETFSTVWSNLKVVIRSWQTWLCALVSLSLYLTTTAFAGLWGASFLRAAHGYSTTKAGVAMSMIFAGWMVGGPIKGFLGDNKFDRKYLLCFASFLAGILLLPVILIPNMSTEWVFTLLFFVGVLSSSQLLTYSYAILINQDEAKGTAVAFTNFLVMLAGALAQPLIGALLDARAQNVDGSLSLTLWDFQFAMLLFPLSLFVASFLALFLKRKSALRVG